MWFGKSILSVLTSPVGQKFYLLRAILRRAEVLRKHKDGLLLDALVEKHVEYCH